MDDGGGPGNSGMDGMPMVLLDGVGIVKEGNPAPEMAEVAVATPLSPPAILKVKADLAYRTPGGDKPLGHIVLDRAIAARLVEEYDAKDGEIDRLWDSIHRLYAFVKSDAPNPEGTPEDYLPKKPPAEAGG